MSFTAYMAYCFDRLVRRAPVSIAVPPSKVRNEGTKPNKAKEPMKAATGSRYSQTEALTASVLLRA